MASFWCVRTSTLRRNVYKWTIDWLICLTASQNLDCGTVSFFSLQIERGRRPSGESGASGRLPARLSASWSLPLALDSPLGLRPRSIWREKQCSTVYSTLGVQLKKHNAASNCVARIFSVKLQSRFSLLIEWAFAIQTLFNTGSATHTTQHNTASNCVACILCQI